MNKEHKVEVRLTSVEKRAVARMAKDEGKSISDLFRARVVNAALAHDPKQRTLPLHASR